MRERKSVRKRSKRPTPYMTPSVRKDEFDRFKYLTSKVLNSHAPLKEKHVRYNQASFMCNSLCKVVMNRLRHLNKLGKIRLMKTNAFKKNQEINV